MSAFCDSQWQHSGSQTEVFEDRCQRSQLVERDASAVDPAAAEEPTGTSQADAHDVIDFLDAPGKLVLERPLENVPGGRIFPSLLVRLVLLLQLVDGQPGGCLSGKRFTIQLIEGLSRDTRRRCDVSPAIFARDLEALGMSVGFLPPRRVGHGAARSVSARAGGRQEAAWQVSRASRPR